MNEDSLHRNTDLTGVVVTSFCEWCDNAFNVRGPVDNHRRGAAMLERASCARCELGSKIPANFRGSDETQECHPCVRGQLLCEGQVIDDCRLAPCLRKSCLTH